MELYTKHLLHGGLLYVYPKHRGIIFFGVQKRRISQMLFRISFVVPHSKKSEKRKFFNYDYFCFEALYTNYTMHYNNMLTD